MLNRVVGCAATPPAVEDVGICCRNWFRSKLANAGERAPNVGCCWPSGLDSDDCCLPVGNSDGFVPALVPMKVPKGFAADGKGIDVKGTVRPAPMLLSGSAAGAKMLAVG